MADPIQSFLSSYGPSETYSIPYPPPTCCCGNTACAYLKHNQNALEGLERDVRTAASLGQALLVRHEAYIADSELERQAMMAKIEILVVEKQALEDRNTAVIGENRDLLDQLAAVNNAVAVSDTHVTSLQATLQSRQQELQRLSHLAARTEQLEQELAEYEREQAIWQASCEAKEGSEKSALRRWQKAERALAEMQDQMERIEREAKEERERHVEVVGRMERRHTVEKELDSAAGRLKGAAAVKTSGREAGGTNVVSHFVKDILQDNANLQLGIVELREMLQNSNDEVESLRDQLQEHQPAANDETTRKGTPKRADLRAELTRANSQELHVHHHYHASASTSTTTTIRRPKKKRHGTLTPGHFTPPCTPRSTSPSGTWSSASTILRQTSVSIPQPVPTKGKRLSAQSGRTCESSVSSGPPSPQSTINRTSSLFDSVFSDAGHESSRPTSPDTEDLGSPLFEPVIFKHTLSSSARTHSAPIVPRQGHVSGVGRAPHQDLTLGSSLDHALAGSQLFSGHDVIPEEVETEWQDESLASTESVPSITSPLFEEQFDPVNHQAFYTQPLRRAASHESLLSVSGMDIHTLTARPSQLLTGRGGRPLPPQAVISDATAHAALPSTMSRPSASGQTLLSGVAAEQRLRNQPSLSSKVGGWMFGRWGATPARTVPETKTSVTSASSSSSRPSSHSSAQTDKAAVDPEATPKKRKVRRPGINQSGPIVGFPPEVRVQRPPVMRSLNEEALKQALGYDALE